MQLTAKLTPGASTSVCSIELLIINAIYCACVLLQGPSQGTPPVTLQFTFSLPQSFEVSVVRPQSSGTNLPKRTRVHWTVSADHQNSCIGGSLKVKSGLSVNYSVVENFSSVLSAYNVSWQVLAQRKI